MRSEKEMYDLLLGIAEQDERILAVYLDGSRTNPNVPEDIFQDYDLVYVVKETKSFIEDKSWIDRFGEILYMQYPDEFPGERSYTEKVYGWLMQFADGNRIDLHVTELKYAQETIHETGLRRILLDKGNYLPRLPEPTDAEFWVKKPSQFEFSCACNEFWWCTNNVAKGLWRDELPYVLDMANHYIRPQLGKMLEWKIGVMTDFGVSAGKAGKFLKRWLSKEDYEAYLSTYFGGNVQEAWEGMMRMCTLMEQTAEWVAGKLGYEYNMTEGRNAQAYLEHVRELPQDAKGVYCRVSGKRDC